MKYNQHKIIKNVRPILLSFLVCFSHLFANTAVFASEPHTISFTTSNSIEPYFLVDKKGGLQYELLNAALEMNHLLLGDITFATNRRALRLVTTKKIDCLINAPSNSDGLFLTQSLIEYQNSVFFLTKNKLKIDTMQDLSNYSLIGFQNASHYLGEEFLALSKMHKNYSEIASQQNQVLMLFGERIQAIILEQRIFDYYRSQIDKRIKTPFEVTKVVLFDPSPRYIACHDPDTTARVNEAISKLKKTDLYQQILLNIEFGNDKHN